ncbi:amidase signature domain-containing protein [Trichoderma sp. SZMC 28011]
MKLLKDAGAVPYVKTNILVTLLSFESSNDVCGRSTNPYNNKYSPGDSTGREGALLTIGGRIGIGGNVAASIRCPGHALGIYSFKCSKGRWMKLGASTSILGQDGIPPAYSPMTRTLDDLTYFTQSVIWVQPLTYEYLTQFILCHGDDMHSLPVGVQVVGRRMKEEKVLAVMKKVEDALGDDKLELLGLD